MRLDALGLGSPLIGEFLRARLTQSRVVANPAVGQDWSTTVPGGTHWLLASVTAAYAADGNVANRQPRLQVLDGDSNIHLSIPSAAFIVASATPRLCWAEGLGASLTTSDQAMPLPVPSDIIPGGWSIRTLTLSRQAGDQWSGIVVDFYELAPGEIAQMMAYIAADFESVTG